jgi:hypothetical protein
VAIPATTAVAPAAHRHQDVGSYRGGYPFNVAEMRAAAASLVWLARRLWRRHAFIEAVPLVAGQPSLSRVARMARLLLTGHALWRLRTRLASPA